MKRKGAGPSGEAGARARAGSAVEIHGSGSKTGEAAKDPERAAGSTPGREKQGCVGRRALEAPAPMCRRTDVGSENQEVGAKRQDSWI